MDLFKNEISISINVVAFAIINGIILETTGTALLFNAIAWSIGIVLANITVRKVGETWKEK